MLAFAKMDATVQGILFLVAVIFFLIAAFSYAYRGVGTEPRRGFDVNLIALGLAFGFFVFMWNAFAAS